MAKKKQNVADEMTELEIASRHLEAAVEATSPGPRRRMLRKTLRALKLRFAFVDAEVQGLNGMVAAHKFAAEWQDDEEAM